MLRKNNVNEASKGEVEGSRSPNSSPLVITLPIRIQSRNVLDRQHWAVKRKDKKMYSLLVRNQMRLHKIPLADPKKYKISIISMRKRQLDYDNLVGGCKYLIDALIDEQFIFDDSPKYLDLKISQVVSDEYSVIISRI